MKIIYQLAIKVLLMLLTSTVHAQLDKTSFYYNFSGTQLVDQNNNPLNVETLKNNTVLVNFIFTQCSNICPVQTKSLAKVKQSLPADLQKQVKFISVSLDPMHDTPAVLKKFAKKMHADDKNWSFLSGKPDDIQHIVDRLSLFGSEEQAKNAQKPDNHLSTLWLINTKGQLMMRYIGNPVNVKRISREIQQLHSLK